MELVGVGDCKMVFISLWYSSRLVLVRIFQTVHNRRYYYRPSLGGSRTCSLAKEINIYYQNTRNISAGDF